MHSLYVRSYEDMSLSCVSCRRVWTDARSFFVACHSTDAPQQSTLFHSCIEKNVCFSKQYFISLSHSFRTWIYHALTLRCPAGGLASLISSNASLHAAVSLCLALSVCCTGDLLSPRHHLLPPPPLTHRSERIQNALETERQTRFWTTSVGRGERWITTSSSTLTTL